MEFTAAKKDFLSALQKVGGIPEQKNLSSVMAHVLLEDDGPEAIRLLAQSYEATMQVRFPARVAESGRLALSGRSLLDAGRMLPDAPVHLKSASNYWADLVAGRTEYRIPGILPENIPTPMPLSVSLEVSLPRDLLLEMVERVGFAMSQDEGRPNLNGICLKAQPEGSGVRIEAVATDGHRLARMIRVVEASGLAEAVQGILHRKGIVELRRFLEGEKGPVQVGFHRSAVFFRLETGHLMVRQIELEYPDYPRVIPTEHQWRFEVDRSELIDAVNRTVVVLGSDRTPLVRLRVETGRMTVSAQDPDKGDARSEMDVAYEGDSFEICYNNRYMLEALKALPGQMVAFFLKDLQNATLIRSLQDDGLLQLIMPLRV